MIHHVVITERGPTPGILRRQMPKILKDTWQVIGGWWHRDRRPIHFTNRASRLYDYEPRRGERGNPHPHGFKQSYTGRKLREMGHTRPLEWSGLSRDRTGVQKVRSTSKGTRIIMNAPTLNLRNPHSKIRMRDEMTRAVPAEYASIRTLAALKLERAARRIRLQKREIR